MPDHRKIICYQDGETHNIHKILAILYFQNNPDYKVIDKVVENYHLLISNKNSAEVLNLIMPSINVKKIQPLLSTLEQRNYSFLEVCQLLLNRYVIFVIQNDGKRFKIQSSGAHFKLDCPELAEVEIHNESTASSESLDDALFICRNSIDHHHNCQPETISKKIFLIPIIVITGLFIFVKSSS